MVEQQINYNKHYKFRTNKKKSYKKRLCKVIN